MELLVPSGTEYASEVLRAWNVCLSKCHWKSGEAKNNDRDSSENLAAEMKKIQWYVYHNSGYFTNASTQLIGTTLG